MPFPQHALDQRIRQIGKVIPGICHAFRLRQVVIYTLDPFMPFIPVPFPDICIHQKLFIPGPQYPGHTGQAGRVPVLLVDLQTIFLAYLIEIAHPKFREQLWEDALRAGIIGKR